jgi:tetratricopeptide (TPR) repeat protein
LSFLLIIVSIFGSILADEKDAKKASELVTKGRELYGTGDIDGALKLFEQALEADITNVDAHRYYQDIMRERGYHEKLLKVYAEYLKVKPDSALFNYLMGRLQTDIEEERKFYKKAIELDDKFYFGHFGLGYIYSSEKDFDNAKKEYAKCVEVDPNRPEGHFWLGKSYRELSEYDEALKTYEKMAQIFPKDPIPYIEMARTQVERGLHKEALDFFKKADSLGAKTVDFIREYAEAYAAVGEKEKAVSTFARTLDIPNLKPDFYELLFHRCRMLFLPPLAEHFRADLEKAKESLRNGDIDEALEQLEKLYKEAQDEPEVIIWLARAYLIKKDVEKGFSYAKKSLEKNNNFAEAHFTIGALYGIQKDWDNAEKHLKRCLELNPFDKEASFHYAQVMLIKGNCIEAIVFALRYYRLGGNLRNTQTLAMLAELNLETPELLEKEFKEDELTVKVYRGLKHNLPGYRFIYRFRVYDKDGNFKRNIFVIVTEEEIEGKLKTTCTMSEITFDEKEQEGRLVEHFKYEKEPTLEKAIEDFKKLLK